MVRILLDPVRNLFISPTLRPEDWNYSRVYSYGIYISFNWCLVSNCSLVHSTHRLPILRVLLCILVRPSFLVAYNYVYRFILLIFPVSSQRLEHVQQS